MTTQPPKPGVWRGYEFFLPDGNVQQVIPAGGTVGNCTVIPDTVQIRLPAWPDSFVDKAHEAGFNQAMSAIHAELTRLGIPFVQEGKP